MLLKNSFQKSHYSNSNCTIGTLGHDKGLKTRVIVTFQNVIKIQTFQTGYETFLSFLNNVSFFCAKRLRIKGGIWQNTTKKKRQLSQEVYQKWGLHFQTYYIVILFKALGSEKKKKNSSCICGASCCHRLQLRKNKMGKESEMKNQEGKHQNTQKDPSKRKLDFLIPIFKNRVVWTQTFRSQMAID